jgi:hypothetical protein
MRALENAYDNASGSFSEHSASYTCETIPQIQMRQHNDFER